MTNTNARLIANESELEGFADLPDPRTLELGSEAESATQPGRQNKTTNKKQSADTTEDRLTKLEKQLAEKDSMIGRQANEIGHLRDLSDQLLKVQVAHTHNVARSSSQDTEVQVSSDDILENPRDAITKVVSPMLDQLVTRIESALGEVNTNSEAERFAGKHPTYQDDMNSPEFQEFVRKSQYRTRLAHHAYQNNDFAAADELWTAWEEAKGDNGSNVEEQEREMRTDEAERQQQLKDASTVRGGAGGGKGVSTSDSRVYSAQKLQEMRNRDPDGYYSPAFQKLIVQAYRENRVR